MPPSRPIATANGRQPTRTTNDEAVVPGWVIRVWLIVGTFAAVTVIRSMAVGISVKDPHGEILRSRLAITHDVQVSACPCRYVTGSML